MHLRDLLNQLPPEVRLQIQNEADPERKKIIFQSALRRQVFVYFNFFLYFELF